MVSSRSPHDFMPAAAQQQPTSTSSVESSSSSSSALQLTTNNSVDSTSFDNGNLDGQRNVSSTWGITHSEPSSLNAAPDSSSSSGSSVSTTTATTNEQRNQRIRTNVVQVGNLAADDEERFEAFGDAVDAIEADSPQGSESPAASPVAGAFSSSNNRNPRSPNSMLLNRNTWLRTSLGRGPAAASRKRLSSNALASQLYRSSSFNSSGRGSICDAADDVYSDVSLEDDVIDLNHRVQMIQEQMSVLVDTQSAGEERYARVKQENATLQARILMLEEANREVETRAEERLETEQRRHREWASRMERERELQLENAAIKLQSVELEATRARDETLRLREQLDKARAEKSRLETSLEEAKLDADRAKEAERRAVLGLAEANRALKHAEEELALRVEHERRIEDMTNELANLRIRNKNLEESRDELQAAAAALQAGRELLLPGAQDPNDNMINRKKSPSLAAELLLTGSAHDQADGTDTGKTGSSDICDNFTTLAEAKQALKEQREVNTRLRSYIDNILLNIVENYPQLLEVKQPH
ncbi:rab11 family-interacting protein 4 isoform X1 [Trichogramma pretiosum]|uniref:rab11 family-interacting protein 4 isoform X1 n=1 Tax=Trichogramma pretiosum TaxID=7493 RepID=UPI0006C9DCFC|nr:rab11 family-interacting protein 4 isoform X1 [Trichogramma pretiosum]